MSYINVTSYIYILYFYIFALALPGSDVSWNYLVRTVLSVRGLQTVRRPQRSQKITMVTGDQLWP